MKKSKKNIKNNSRYLNEPAKNIFDVVDKFYSISLNEYVETFNRREKLDNKINILFTAYAFFVLLYIELLKIIALHNNGRIKELFIRFTKINISKVVKVLCNLKLYISDLILFLFCILIIAITFLLLYNIRKMLKLLSGIDLSHFDSNEILSKNMFGLQNLGCIKFIIENFEQCKNENNKLLDNKYRVFNNAIKLTILLVSLIVLAFLMGIFI